MTQSQATRLQRGDTAPHATVRNADNMEIAVANLWATQPVVLAFLRHFG
jgi:peroxiredoxin